MVKLLLSHRRGNGWIEQSPDHRRSCRDGIVILRLVRDKI